MRGVLIFDHLNDILFTKCNAKFAKHVEKLAKNQGLISEKVNMLYVMYYVNRINFKFLYHLG